MIHMGQTVSPLPKLLALLKPGDIVTHMFAPPPNSIIDDSGHILPEVIAARRRGVWFDLGNGRAGHLRWDTAESVLKAGFLPDTFSTDWTPEGRTAQVAGLRYFNVYGPNEAHKGRMASVAFHAFNQFRAEGRVKLFEGSDGYGDGEQQRDFVHVDDAVGVNLWLLENRDISGIFNCGTGRAQTFNEVAVAVINTIQGTEFSIQELIDKGFIEYIPFPAQLVGKYQSYTQADLGRLREAGYPGEFQRVEDGVAAYVRELLKA